MIPFVFATIAFVQERTPLPLLRIQKAHSPITIRATNNWHKDVAVLDPEYATETAFDVGPVDARLARAVRGQWQLDDVAHRVEILVPVLHFQDLWRKHGLGKRQSVNMGWTEKKDGRREEKEKCGRRSWNNKSQKRLFYAARKMWLKSWSRSVLAFIHTI